MTGNRWVSGSLLRMVVATCSSRVDVLAIVVVWKSVATGRALRDFTSLSEFSYSQPDRIHSTLDALQPSHLTVSKIT